MSSGSPVKPGGNRRPDREIAAAADDRFRGAADHCLEQFNARLRTFGAEAIEAIQNQPGRKDNLDGERDLGFPAARHLSRRTLHAAGILEQRSRASIEHLSCRCEEGFAALDLERAQVEQFLDLLHCIGHRGLALVQCLRSLRVAAGIDDSDQAAPLFEGDAGRKWFFCKAFCSHISNK